ncbi:MAG: GxxExxY protein, partial [Bacteroidetes bacterium]|nr:GxxExxY protein [Bacteroidota bacterium]
HLAQGLNYLEAYKLEIGLLINFGSKRLEFKRLTNERKLHNQIIKQT